MMNHKANIEFIYSHTEGICRAYNLEQEQYEPEIDSLMKTELPSTPINPLSFEQDEKNRAISTLFTFFSPFNHFFCVSFLALFDIAEW